MARHRKNAQGAIIPTPARLVQPLTGAQGKLLDALIDDPTISPADLCDRAGVPAYTWRRALRSPAFASALLDAQRSALDASRLSRTQAAIEKASSSPAFARLCFQIDGSIKEAPCLVQQFNQQVINMPVSQLRKSFEAGNVVDIPDLNYNINSKVTQLPVIPQKQEKKEVEGLTKCPQFNDNKPTLTLPLPRSGHPKCTEVVDSTRYEVRSDTRCSHSEVIRGDKGAGIEPEGRAWAVSRAQAGQAQGTGQAGSKDEDEFDLL
jgi:hypothetical protein